MFSHCISILSSLRSLFFLVPFLLSFLSLFLISHLIFSSPLVIFSPFLEQPLIRSKGGNFLPISSNHIGGPHFSTFIPYFFISFFFYIINHMASCEPWDSFPTHANCEPFLFVPSVTLLWCHVASLNLVICHSTPHASKNVKSLPPRNPTKFDVVAKFRETISTEKYVSSSEI